MSQQIEAVYRRALLLRQRATESPVQPNLLEDALGDLAFVLEELQVSQEELRLQNQALFTTHQQVEVERQRYHELFNLAPDGYLVTDRVAMVQEANQAIAAMLNVSQSYLIGKPFSVFVSDASRPALYAMLEQLNQPHSLSQTQAQSWEIQICPRHKAPLDVAITLSMTCYSENNGVTCRWLLRDVTSQKQVNLLLEQLNTALEGQVQERTAQLQQALDFETSLKRITDKVRDSLDEEQILQTVVQELTQTLDILGCDTTFYERDFERATARYWSNQVDNPEIALPQQSINRTTFPEADRQLLQGQFFQFCEVTPNVALTQVAILICPIADDQTVVGELRLFKPSTETFGDSEIRLVQQVANQCAIAIRQARLYQTSQQHVQELEQLHQLKDDFLSSVSHELRTPLANMNMAMRMLEVMLKRPEQFADQQDRVTRYLKILRTEYNREVSLINDLLDLSRLDANTEPLVLTTLELNSWLPQIIAPFEERMHSQQQHLQVDLLTDLPALTTDASLLERILTELLNNACKYTPPNHAIAVGVTDIDQGLQISISNSGVSLPDKELNRLFDKFYRVPAHDPWKRGGTGLGLALVKQQVERIQGTISVSNLQPWITFVLQIPWEIAPEI